MALWTHRTIELRKHHHRAGRVWKIPSTRPQTECKRKFNQDILGSHSNCTRPFRFPQPLRNYQTEIHVRTTTTRQQTVDSSLDCRPVQSRPTAHTDTNTPSLPDRSSSSEIERDGWRSRGVYAGMSMPNKIKALANRHGGRNPG